jgi:hypothetical protein
MVLQKRLHGAPVEVRMVHIGWPGEHGNGQQTGTSHIPEIRLKARLMEKNIR